MFTVSWITRWSASGASHSRSRSSVLRKFHLPLHARGVVALAMILVAVDGYLLVAGAGRHTARAAASTPPPPPAYLPTPVGPPPAPPTPVGTATTATATAAPTATASAPTAFSVDAVRVSKRNNSGDMSGLEAVTPGSTVWLMIYYTIKNLPRAAMRVDTYRVSSPGKNVFRAVYKEKTKAHSSGRFSVYTVWNVPRHLAFGRYTLFAVVALGKQREAGSWNFSVAKRQRAAKTTRGR